MSVTLNGTVANIVEVTQNKYVHRVLHTSREEKTIYTYMKSHWYYGNLFSKHSSETVEEIKWRGGAYSADNFFFYFSQFKLPYNFLHRSASSEIADFMDFIYLALNEDHLLNVISNLCTF